MVSNKAPLRGSPIIQIFFKFSFILVHSFSLSFFDKQERNDSLLKTRVLNKGFEQRRAFGPEGAQ
jgi:hypothetical protein